jgi:hypothetical protein
MTDELSALETAVAESNAAEAKANKPEGNDEGEAGSSPAAAETTPQAPGTWDWAEGVPGSEEAPEWFDTTKYKTVADQAKAYTELSKKMGSFIGAPKDGYDISSFEKELDMSSPFIQQFKDAATKMNMSQSGFDGMLTMFSDYEKANTFDADAFVKSLTPEEKNIAITVSQWSKNNFSSEECEILDEWITDKNSLMMLAKIRGMARIKGTTPEGAKPVRTVTKKDIESIITENYEKYRTDESYRNRIENLRTQVID